MDAEAWRLTALLLACVVLPLAGAATGQEDPSRQNDDTREPGPWMPRVQTLAPEGPAIDLHGPNASGLLPANGTVDARPLDSVDLEAPLAPLPSVDAFRPRFDTRISTVDLLVPVDPSPSPNPARTHAPDREGHPPIVIVGDRGPTGFALAPDPTSEDDIARPASGVRSGNGSAANPYVISGWNVSTITIQDTDAHVVVRNNTVRGPSSQRPATLGSGDEAAIELDDADNVTIQHNHVQADPAGVDARQSDHLDIEANHFPNPSLALRIEGGRDVTVASHAFLFEGFASDPPLATRDVDQLEVVDNRFSGGPVGLTVQGGHEIVVRGNAFLHIPTGVGLNATEQVRIEANRFLENGIGLAHVEDGSSTVVENEFRGGSVGVLATNDTALSARDNGFLETPIGVYAGPATRGQALDNHVEKAGYAGLVLEGSTDWTLAANEFSDSEVGVLLLDDADPHVVGNRFRTNVYGLVVVEARGVVELNRFQGDEVGVAAVQASGTQLADNTFRSEDVGVLAQLSSALEVHRNRFPTGISGLALAASPGASVTGNAFQGNGVLLAGDRPGDFRQHISPSNTVEGEPIRYRWGQAGSPIQGAAGQIIVANASSARIQDARVQGATVGVHVAFADDVTIANSTVEGSPIGVVLQQANATSLENATIRAGPGLGTDEAFYGVYSARNHGTRIESSLLDGYAAGLLSLGGSKARVANTTARGEGVGLALLGVQNATLQANAVDHEGVDVYLYGSPHTQLWDNRLARGGLIVLPYDPFGFGEVEDPYEQEIDASNTVQGAPLRYVANEDGIDVATPAGQIYVANSSDVTALGPAIRNTSFPFVSVDSENVTLEDGRIEGEVPVVSLEGTNLTVADSLLQASRVGLQGAGTVEATLAGNRLEANGSVSVGVLLQGAKHADVLDNEVTGFPTAIEAGGREHVLEGNQMTGGGLLVTSLGSGEHAIDSSNLVDGEPVRYVNDTANVTVEASPAQLFLANATNVTARGLSFDNATIGVHAAHSSDVTVEDVEVRDQAYGIVLDGSPNSTLQDNRIQNVSALGLAVADSPGNRVVDNHVKGSPGQPEGSWFTWPVGIYVTSTHGDVRANTVEQTGIGIQLAWGEIGGEQTDLVENDVLANGIGIDTRIAFTQPAIHWNNVEDNQHAGLVSGPFFTNATRNWWGCSQGPRATQCDNVTGDARVAPWLTEPIDGADSGGDEAGLPGASGIQAGSRAPEAERRVSLQDSPPARGRALDLPEGSIQAEPEGDELSEIGRASCRSPSLLFPMRSHGDRGGPSHHMHACLLWASTPLEPARPIHEIRDERGEGERGSGLEVRGPAGAG